MAPAVGTNAVCLWLEKPGPWQITQSFGPTDVSGEPICDGSQTHRGIDIGVPAGNWTIIPHALTGSFKVNVVGEAASRGYGNLVIVRDVTDATGQKWDVYLAHHSSVAVVDGSNVGPGSRLAITDCTGFCTGPHLHFEVRPAGSDSTCASVDPTWMMQDPTGTGDATLTNIQLLNGGLDLNPLAGVAEAITAAEQYAAQTAIGLATGIGGGIMMLAGGITSGLVLAKTSPQEAIAAAQNRLAPAPPPPRPTTGRPPRQYTATERKWRPSKMPVIEPVTVESARAKLASGQRLTMQEAQLLGANKIS